MANDLNMPSLQDYEDSLVVARTGKAVRFKYVDRKVPEDTSVLICAMSIDPSKADAILATIAGIDGVNLKFEIARGTVPSWTPEDCEWKVYVETGLRFHEIQ